MWLFNLAFPYSHLWNDCLKEKETINWLKTFSDTENVIMWSQDMQLHRWICGSFLTIRLPSPQLSSSAGHLTRGPCMLTVSRSQTSLEQAALYKINVILWCRKYKIPHQPLSLGRKGTCPVERRGPAGWLIPLCFLSRVLTVVKHWSQRSTGQWNTVSRPAAMSRDWLWSQITWFLEQV